jgi:hypothetical protein
MVREAFFLRIGTGFFAFSGLRFGFALAFAGELSFALGMVGNLFEGDYEPCTFAKNTIDHLSIPMYAPNWHKFIFLQNINYRE